MEAEMNKLIVAPYAGLASSASVIALTAATLVFTPDTYFFDGVVAPVVEETIRYGIALNMLWVTTPGTAAAIGAAWGFLEVAAKMIESNAHVGLDVRTLLNVAGFSPSIPIHIALSLAFYSYGRGRWWRNVLLHSALNLTLLAVAGVMWKRLDVPAYAAALVAASTAICGVVTFLALQTWHNWEKEDV
jgi:hypothetical protein